MRENPLVRAAELAAELTGGTPPHVLDVRWWLGGPPGVDAYLAGHLPGAVFADVEDAFSGPAGDGGRHPLPSPERFTEAMRRAGVRLGRPVVVYDDGDCWAAARAWWCLGYFGHDDVRVLDGGYQAWTAGNHPVTTDPPDVAEGDFVARPGGRELLDAEGAARLARAGVLLDARAGERYRGEVEPIDPVAGHVPGAVSAPTVDNRSAGGRFLEPTVLRERYAAAGVDAVRPVGVYCGSGVSAAHTVLALELAGVTAALYVGSWSDWVSDPSRPVATGADPG